MTAGTLEAVLLWLVIAAFLIGFVLAVIELRRLADLLEAVNHAIERVAVQISKKK